MTNQAPERKANVQGFVSAVALAAQKPIEKQKMP